MSNAFGGKAAKEAARAAEEQARMQREQMERETIRMQEAHALSTANSADKVAKVVGQDEYDSTPNTEEVDSGVPAAKKKKKTSDLLGFK